MHTDRCGNTCRQKSNARGNRKEVKIQQLMWGDIMNVESAMQDYSSRNWSHWKSNKWFKEKYGSHTTKTFNRFTTNDSYTWNITHNMESITV